MSFFRIRENGDLKTQGNKTEKIKTYTSIEQIMKDIEAIKIASKDEKKDKTIDMIYKLVILYRGYNPEDNDTKTKNSNATTIFKNVSNDIWDAINDGIEQLKEEFSEEELLKTSKKNRKDMYILNLLYGGIDAGSMISLFHEKKSFDIEYELSNDCTYESLDKNTLDVMEISAKNYLRGKELLKK